MLWLSLPLTLFSVPDDWPEWRGPQRDGVWREEGVLEELPETLEARWRVPISSGYAAPSVADGRVIVMDRETEPAEIERVLAFDATSGERLWSHSYDASYAGISYPAGPRCAPLIAGERVYTLGSVGHLCCLDVTSGEEHWARDLREEYTGLR